jgi:hypothetical protein
VTRPEMFGAQTPLISTMEDDSQGTNERTVALFQDNENVETEKLVMLFVAFDTRTLTPVDACANRTTQWYIPEE